MTSYREFNDASLKPFIQELTSLSTKITHNCGMGIDDIKKVDILKHIIHVYNQLKSFPALKLEEINKDLEETGKEDVKNLPQYISSNTSSPATIDFDSPNASSVLNLFNLNSHNNSDSESEEDFDPNIPNSEEIVKEFTKASLHELEHIKTNRWYSACVKEESNDEDSDGEFEEQITDSECNESNSENSDVTEKDTELEKIINDNVDESTKFTSFINDTINKKLSLYGEQKVNSNQPQPYCTTSLFKTCDNASVYALASNPVKIDIPKSISSMFVNPVA